VTTPVKSILIKSLVFTEQICTTCC